MGVSIILLALLVITGLLALTAVLITGLVLRLTRKPQQPAPPPSDRHDEHITTRPR